MSQAFVRRTAGSDDPEVTSAALTALGCGRPMRQYKKYPTEQRAGTEALVRTVDDVYAGYIEVR